MVAADVVGNGHGLASGSSCSLAMPAARLSISRPSSSRAFGASAFICAQRGQSSPAAFHVSRSARRRTALTLAPSFPPAKLCRTAATTTSCSSPRRSASRNDTTSSAGSCLATLRRAPICRGFEAATGYGNRLHGLALPRPGGFDSCATPFKRKLEDLQVFPRRAGTWTRPGLLYCLPLTRGRSGNSASCLRQRGNQNSPQCP
jgi:hypothetical protein